MLHVNAVMFNTEKIIIRDSFNHERYLPKEKQNGKKCWGILHNHRLSTSGFKRKSAYDFNHLIPKISLGMA